jgi:hypothetical protein
MEFCIKALIVIVKNLYGKKTVFSIKGVGKIEYPHVEV